MRIQYEGALYHIFSRGNNQQDIFVTDDDRYLFLDTTGQMAQRFDCDIFSYVLMDNHYHLLLRTPKANRQHVGGWRSPEKNSAGAKLQKAGKSPELNFSFDEEEKDLIVFIVFLLKSDKSQTQTFIIDS